jgi:hypothetical protein
MAASGDFSMAPATPGLWSFHVFVSYRGKDHEAARALTICLQRRGLRAWWDMDPGEHDRAPRIGGDVRGQPIPGGDDAVESELGSAIAGSMVTAVITSVHTRGSLWVRREIDIARALQRPLFFWHLIETDTREHAPSAESVEFMRELHDESGLNVIGHLAGPLSGVQRVCDEVNVLVELSELVSHGGASVTADSLQRTWPQYESLRTKAASLEATIEERFGRRIEAGRTPIAHAFRLKRPFAVRRVRHLERILEDERFRRAEIGE